MVGSGTAQSRISENKEHDMQHVITQVAVIGAGTAGLAAYRAARAAGKRALVNAQVFDWTDLPRAVAVFGPGVIGLELGQALSRLGVKIHIFGRGHGIGPLSDPAVRQYATKTFQRDFYLDPDAKVHSVECDGDGVRVHFRHYEDHDVDERFDCVLAATCRTSNVPGMGLEHT